MAAFNSEKYISQAIESVIDQSIGFKKNIQLIIVDDDSSDNTLSVARFYQEKYPENIQVFHLTENWGPACARNIGLKYADADFVNFLDSDDYISEYTFSNAYKFLTKHEDVNIASVPIYYFGARRGDHSLNYKFTKTRVVNLMDEPDAVQLSGASSFFRLDALKNYSFNESLRVSEDPLLINQILIDNPLIGFISDCAYYYRKHEDSKSLIGDSANNKSYYTSRIDEYFIKLIDYSLEKLGEVPSFIQYVLMQDLQWLFSIKSVNQYLSRSELHDLYKKLMYILSFIDHNVIINQREIEGALKAHILLLRDFGFKYYNDKSIAPKPATELALKLDLNTVYIDICQVKNNNLYILGYITAFHPKRILKVIINDGEEVEITKLDFPQRANYSLSYNYAFNNHFDVSIPLDGLNKVSFKSDDFDLKIMYNQTSRLSKTSGYLLSKKHLIVNHDDYISVEPRTAWNLISREFKTLKNIIMNRSEGWRTGLILRLAYFLTYPYYNNKHLWLFMDLPYLAEDNAYHLFRYVSNNPDIDKFFAIKKDDTDIHDVEILANRYQSGTRKSKIRNLLGLGKGGEQYSKIDEIGFALPYGSLKHRLYTLFAEVIISSNPDNNIIYPFWANYTYLSGLMRSKTVFLQHGVTKDDTSDWLKKYDKNLDLIVTVSEMEKQSFMDYNYGYDDSTVQVLGFPRFDSLEAEDDLKEIVVMPTWRRQYNDLKPDRFCETDFFQVFNELLNDDELMEFLNNHNYKLLFKPHPNLTKFIHLFDKADNVVFTDKSYNEIFNHSSLLITDYSSVSFDFAYLKKPVIYFQYGDDYHFNVDTGYFKYDSMGFGPVCHDLDNLKENIKSIVLNGCEMESEYKARVSEFFKFDDKSNSNRVFDAISNLDFDY